MPGGRPWSLGARLVWRLSAILGVLWAAATIISVAALRHEINEVYDSALEETAQRLLPLAEAYVGLGPARRDLASRQTPQVAEYDEFLIYQLRNATGQVIIRSRSAPMSPFPVALVPGSATVEGRPYYTAAGADGLFLQVTEPPDHRTEAVTQSTIALGLTLLLLVPVAALSILWSVRRTVGPLRQVGDEFRCRDGDNLEPIDETGLPDEIVPVIREVNRLFERLVRALAGERSFAAHAAHALRTPVAAALAQCQRLEALLEDDALKARAGQVATRLRGLGRLVETQLQLARADAGIAGAGPADLMPALRLVVEDYRRRSGVADRLRFDDGGFGVLCAALDIDAFGMAIGNLIDNALAHGDRTQPVAVVVEAGPQVSVRNGGPVIREDLLHRLVDRFQRGDTAASGSGLGLAIVDTIMRQAGGDLRLRSPAPGRLDGFEATLVLPGSALA